MKALDRGLEHLEHPLGLGRQLGIAAGHRQQPLVAAVVGHGRRRNRLLGLGGQVVVFARRQHPGEGRHQGDDDEKQGIDSGELALLGRRG
ncbi:hypothetical protein D3C72_895950 [compost metagenome]